jgi:hypothetical protein
MHYICALVLVIVLFQELEFFSWKSRSVIIEWVAFRLHILRIHIQISACYNWIVLNGKDFQRKLCKIIYGLQLVCIVSNGKDFQRKLCKIIMDYSLSV